MIENDDDLWRLFGGTSAKKPGKHDLSFAEFFDRSAVLDIGVKNKKKPFRPQFKFNKRDRLYRLRSSDIEAVVHEARVFATAKKFGDPDLTISYLGKNEPA